MNKKTFAIFSVYGIELEYMIVDRNTLDVIPIADKLIEKISGKIQNEFSCGDIAISNELALHVIEFKTDGPTPSLENLARDFHQQIIKVNQQLETLNARLMPTGAHPWLNPHKGITLWPHGNRKIYQAYDKIFNCAGHGWGNLQSMHLNLPFANDHEFKILHDAIRLILPIIPALTASTPILESDYCGYIDGRLHYYGKNQQKIPLIAGDLIPEPVNSKAEYIAQILEPMYNAIAPFDADNILQDEWLNSRAAIARFERNAIEIRIIDIQEAPLVDIAFAEMIVAVLKNLTVTNQTKQIASKELKEIFAAVIEAGSATQIGHTDYLHALGITAKDTTAKVIWQELFNNLKSSLSIHTQTVMQAYLQHGNLAERIKKAVGEKVTASKLHLVYKSLCECLDEDKIFLP